MKKILITGAAGELGHSLIDHFAGEDGVEIVALDLNELPTAQRAKCADIVKASIVDAAQVESLGAKHQFDQIFHLAAILSTGGERDPVKTHEVNVQGALNLLNLTKRQSEKRGSPVTFIFPSTIAIYGIGSLKEKQAAGAITEDQFLNPITMYGVNKLSVEHLGRYYSEYFKLLDTSTTNTKIDFRCLRYPGIVSAETMPTGGTSDYGPEMLHAAAQGRAYECFVRPDARLPFMVAPDAVRAIVGLAQARVATLSRRVYNVGSFSVSAEEIHQEILKYFPEAKVTYKPSGPRQRIVDSWPGDVDDTAARRDWGWKPEFDRARSFKEYLIPAVVRRYRGASVGAATVPLHA